ncbi:MAG: hypothetical protein ACLR23_03450 [Clostridia bacterium]
MRGISIRNQTGTKRFRCGSNDILIGSFQRECKDKWKKWKGGAVIWCSFQEIHPRVPQDYPAVIYATHASMFKVAKSMALCIPIETMVLDEDEIEMFQMEDALEDVTDTILASPARIFPVVDRGGVVMGAISKSNLMQVNQPAGDPGGSQRENTDRGRNRRGRDFGDY